ncbi:MAG: twin-arginine translocase subunit TatC [Candidatus Marinimicrobia bacterium CG08_land_8_20_14_0_20_45_22]|nr:MAG: twin-arginine translocase subunit TatC [Candidatus Marinimicrobia bacterium CG08_land_8_20_14_0_20_45_22]
MKMTDKSMKYSRKDSSEDSTEMGFLDHLEELRWRLIKILIAVFVFTIAGFFFSDFFLNLLIEPSKELDMKIQVLKVQGLLMLKFWIAFVVGIVFSIPVLGYQLWAFVAPGLYQKEKNWGPWLVVSITAFFLLGALFAYTVLVPFAMKFLIGVGVPDVQKNISIEFYAKFVTQLIVGTGLIFQLPVVSYILTKMGLVSPSFLRRSWRYAFMAILVLAAAITPPDPFSMIVMTIPLVFLYELSIIVSRFALRSSEKAVAV